MPCKYYALNNQPSKLFDSLFSHFQNNGMDEKQSEIQATRAWLFSRSPQFFDQFGDWRHGDTSLRLDENGEPHVLTSDQYAYYDTKKGLYDAVTGEPISIGTGPKQSAGVRLRSVNNTFDLLRSMIKEGENTKLARGILVAADKPIRIEMVQDGHGSINYTASTNTLYAHENFTQHRELLDSVLLSETTKAYTEKEIASNPDVTTAAEGLYQSAKKVLNGKVEPQTIKSRDQFIHEAFTNKTFQSDLMDAHVPGEKQSLWDSTVKFLGNTFDLRTSYLPEMSSMLVQAAAVRSTQQTAPLYQKEEGEEQKAEEPEEKPKEVVQISAPFSHLLTGDPTLDKYISATFEKIQGLRSRLQRKGKETENARIRGEIAKYEGELNRLVESKTIGMLLNVGQREVMRLENALEANQSMREIGENYKLLEAWSEFSTMFDLSETNLAGQIRQVAIKAMELKDEYSNLYLSQLKKELLQEGVPIQYVEQLDPERVIEDIGKLAADFVGLSFAENGLEVAADFMIRKSAYDINHDMINFNHRLEEKLKKLGSKDISFMFSKDESGRSRPLTKYKRELYEKISAMRGEISGFEKDRAPLYNQIKELNKDYYAALKAGDKAAVENINQQREEVKRAIAEHKTQTKSMDNLNEFMRQNFDFTLDEEGREAHNKFAEDYKQNFFDYNPETGENEFSQLKYERGMEQYDVDAYERWVKEGGSYPSRAAQFFAITPKEEWLDTHSFAKLSPVQKEFYDFFTEEYMEAQANVPMDYAFTDYNADQLLREFSFMDGQTVNKFQHLLGEIKEFIKDTVTVKHYETNLSVDQIAPFSKKPIQNLKFKPVKDFIVHNDGYFREGEELPGSLRKGLEEGRYKYKDGLLVSSVKEKVIKRIEQIEDDPLKIFTNFKKYALAYKYKKEVEDTLNGIREIAAISSIEPVNRKGIHNLLGKRTGIKGGSQLESRLSYTIDAFLNGRLKDPLKASLEAKPGERQFSFGRSVESLNTLTRARQLGFNYASGVTNLAMGTVNNYMYAARDEFFNEAELSNAYAILRHAVANWYSFGGVPSTTAKKIAMLAAEFNILGNMQEQFYLDRAWMEKLFEKMYVFMKGGEYMNQGATMVAMMLRQKVHNAEGKEIGNLWDAFEEKDNKLVFKHPDADYASKEKQFTFANGVGKVNKEIHGDYDLLNPMMAKKGLLGRVGLLFRTWMPQAVKQRLGKRYLDYQLSALKGEDVYREGRWRSLGQLIASDITVQDKFANIGKFFGSMLLHTFSNKLGRKAVDSMTLDAADRANMYVNIKEAWWLMALTVASLGLRGLIMGDDDKDDKVKMSWLKYLYNQSSRVESELWFFYDPISTTKIIRDAIPLWDTIKQSVRVGQSAWRFIAHNDQDQYQRGFRKGDSKFATQLQIFFPILKQKQSLWSMAAQMYSNQYY